MFIQQLISPDIPVLKPEDSGENALHLFQELSLTHLPLVDNKDYKALISEADVLDWEHPEQALGRAPFLHYSPIVHAHLHPYEAARLLVQQDLDVLPVIEESNSQYIGAVSRAGLLEYMVSHSGVDKPGGIVVLEMKPVDYSLSEITRICESSDVTVTNVQVFSYPDQEKIEVVLKTNTLELQSLVASFDRYEYQIKEVFAELKSQEGMLERYQSLMHYINM